MNEITRILSTIAPGDTKAAERLLPLVYEALRKLAAARLARMKPGQTLQPTALVHEAYLRLVGKDRAQDWNSRGHFFGAAAKAMQRILVDRYRQKRSEVHGGHLVRIDFEGIDVAVPPPPEDLIALDEALEKLEVVKPTAAQLVRLRFFCGLTNAEAAGALEIPPRSADRLWDYARFWLLREIRRGP
jgi:RNA polymerase sigma factor (TIGR02999 family)